MVTFIAVQWPTSVTPASADEPGATPGTGAASVTVMAYPNDDVLRAMKDGDSMTMYAVTASVHAMGSGADQVTVDRASVPPQAVETNGVVNFALQLLNGDGSVTNGSFSLLEDPTDPTQWLPTDDGAAAASVLTRGQRGRASARAARLRSKLAGAGFTATRVTTTTGRVDEDTTAARSNDDENDGPNTSGTGAWSTLIKKLGAPDDGLDNVSGRSGVANCILQANADFSTTVATSYPVGGDVSWLTYSGSMSTKTGTAVTYGGGATFHADSTKSTADSWGENFAPSSANRSYRIGVNYGLYGCANLVTGYTWYQVTPRYQTGGTGQNVLSAADRPAWDTPSNCTNVAVGDWWRGHQSGNDYSLSYGVKSADAIGIYLSSEHGYSTGTQLHYLVGKKRKICGNNAVPALASKLIERNQ